MILTERRLALRHQGTDHDVGMLADAQRATQRIRAAEELHRRARPDETNAGLRALLGRSPQPPRRKSEAADRKVREIRPHDRRARVRERGHHLNHGAREDRDAGEGRRLAPERLRVAVREPRCRPEGVPYAAPRSRLVEDIHDVRPEALDTAPDPTACSLPESGHDHDGGDADEDTEDGQKRAQWRPDEGDQRHPNCGQPGGHAMAT